MPLEVSLKTGDSISKTMLILANIRRIRTLCIEHSDIRAVADSLTQPAPLLTSCHISYHPLYIYLSISFSYNVSQLINLQTRDLSRCPQKPLRPSRRQSKRSQRYLQTRRDQLEAQRVACQEVGTQGRWMDGKGQHPTCRRVIREQGQASSLRTYQK